MKKRWYIDCKMDFDQLLYAWTDLKMIEKVTKKSLIFFVTLSIIFKSVLDIHRAQYLGICLFQFTRLSIFDY